VDVGKCNFYLIPWFARLSYLIHFSWMNLKTKKKNPCTFYSCGFDQYLCVKLMVAFTTWSMVLIVLKAGGKVGSYISSGGFIRIMRSQYMDLNCLKWSLVTLKVSLHGYKFKKICKGMKHGSWNQEWTKGGVRVNVCMCECKIAWSFGAIQKDCIQACGKFIQ